MASWNCGVRPSVVYLLSSQAIALPAYTLNIIRHIKIGFTRAEDNHAPSVGESPFG